MKITNVILFFFLSISFANSQVPIDCGITSTQSSSVVYGSGCLDVQSVFDNCELLFLGVNVHYFLDDNFENPLNPGAFVLDPYSCYETAEELISKANILLENNMNTFGTPSEWGDYPFAPASCNPLRYVLKGVYIHNNTEAQSVTWAEFGNLRNDFGVNIDTELNIFFTDLNLSGHPSAGGVGDPFHSAQEYFSAGLLNHELGHSFSLIHTFSSSEPCDDTPNIVHSWDHDCDPNTAVLNNRECWNIVEGGACNPPQGCEPNPCCNWKYVNNNVMANNAFQDAYTDCQIEQLLNNINDKKCDFIVARGVDICPPPSAVVDVHVLDDLRTEYCSYCLRLEASSNELEYMLDFYEVTPNGTESFHTTTGWLDGPAERYCIVTKKEKSTHNTWFGGFKPTTTYKVTMTVVNSCGDISTTDYTFTTPMTYCTQVYVGDENPELTLYPNPITNNLSIDYEITSTSEVRVLASHPINGKYGGDLEYTRAKPAGSHSLSVNTTSWFSGVNYVIIQIDDRVYSSAIIKL